MESLYNRIHLELLTESVTEEKNTRPLSRYEKEFSTAQQNAFVDALFKTISYSCPALINPACLLFAMLLKKKPALLMHSFLWSLIKLASGFKGQSLSALLSFFFALPCQIVVLCSICTIDLNQNDNSYSLILSRTNSLSHTHTYLLTQSVSRPLSY